MRACARDDQGVQGVPWHARIHLLDRGLCRIAVTPWVLQRGERLMFGTSSPSDWALPRSRQHMAACASTHSLLCSNSPPQRSPYQASSYRPSRSPRHLYLRDGGDHLPRGRCGAHSSDVGRVHVGLGQQGAGATKRTSHSLSARSAIQPATMESPQIFCH